MGSVDKRLPSKPEALSSISSTTKKKKKKVHGCIPIKLYLQTQMVLP
jgi:hypothetical protein